ncbi:MAG: PfkB family carbohydrate kinase [Gammaproteobacteria bacterium]|nr:PfkB family carbohydrate kinase [Gammaproteobacteria bacterium]
MNCGRLCVFGEVLFDHFPDGKRVLGGAPFNVAWHLQAFGQMPYFISRVGDDSEGGTVRRAMHEWGMHMNGLQTDAHRPTGRVNVRFVAGEPAYDIQYPCAYDAIEVERTGCGMVYHGTLALREAVSRRTVAQLKASGPRTVFVDVNLRRPWWQRQQVLDTVHGVDWVKLNTDELALLYPSDEDATEAAAGFIAEYRLKKGLILTHGSQGAELLTVTGYHVKVQPDRDGRVVDTVGAGDAFAAVIIAGLVNDWPLDRTMQRAQTFASKLVGSRGATVNDPLFYQPFLEAWDLLD